ncbi:hypothetical protein Hanom_Chr08g00711631 [Helianthus anomalus]
MHKTFSMIRHKRSTKQDHFKPISGQDQDPILIHYKEWNRVRTYGFFLTRNRFFNKADRNWNPVPVLHKCTARPRG